MFRLWFWWFSRSRLRGVIACLGAAACVVVLAQAANPDPLMTEAKEALKKKAYASAYQAIERFLTQHPDDAEGLSVKGYILFHQDKPAEALLALNASLKSDPLHTASIGTRAYVYNALNDIDRAISDASRAIELTPKNLPLYILRRDLYGRKKAWNLAIGDANTVIAQEAHDPDAHYRRALLYFFKNAYAEAFDDIDETILLKPAIPEGYEIRARLFLRTGQDEKAIADFEQCLVYSESKAPIANELAWTLCTDAKATLRNPTRALELANQACVQSPNNSQYIDTQAAAFAAAGEFDLAIKSQTFALKLAPKDKKKDFQSRLDLYEKHQAAVEPVADAAVVTWDRTRFDCFDQVWRTVDEQYFDASVTGEAWRTVRENYRLPISNARNDDELRWTLQQMLGELHRSHFAIIPRETAVFHPEERSRQGSSGVHVAAIGENIYISRVDPKSAGNRARLVASDQIVSVEGENIASMYKSLIAAGLSPRRALTYIRDGMEARFNGPVGQAIKLEVVGLDRKTHGSSLLPQPFDGIWSEPVGNFPSEPIELETRRDKSGIAYARFSVFALPVVKPLKTFFKSLSPTDGLIIDLRGNPGGAIIIAPGLCGWLCNREATLGTLQLRDDQVPLEVYPQTGAFTGPIAVLIDGSSASTSEVFSSGLRGLGRARLFGTATAGAALPSLYRRLPNGDLFQFAVGDIHTASGTSLEGSAGVAPDTEGDFAREDLLKGRDPVLDAARAWLARARKDALHHPHVAWR